MLVLWATGRQTGCGVARPVMSIMRCVSVPPDGPWYYTWAWEFIQNFRHLNPLYTVGLFKTLCTGSQSQSADCNGCSSYADECV